MLKSYRTIHQWNYWLSCFLGKELLTAETNLMLTMLAQHYGKHAVLIGVPKQYSLLKNNPITDHLLLTPLVLQDKTIRYIESDWHELPISSGSVDLVVLPHSLEHIDNPRQVLSEACRIVKPEGLLVIFGFNPYSLWGLQQKWNKMHGQAFISKGDFLTATSIKQWLALADFELVKHKTFLFRPPLKREKFFLKLKLVEWIGDKCCLPFGGGYVLMAKAKVIPFTPIRLHWKQPLASTKLTLPGSSARNYNF